ncbi:MAG: vitamin K epoxide reductase family protein [Pirellulales bacterium]
MIIGNSTNPFPGGPRSFLSVPLQWAVRVLAWLAFGICVFLAFKALGHGVAAGCIAGSPDCDAVQSSIWSVWLGVPVALLGLACYSSLAGLSVLTGLTNPGAARWINTFLTLLALAAALSGLWFTAIQLFVISKVCLECIAVHLCGIAIAAILFWAVFGNRPRRPGVRSAASGLMALRAAMPAAPIAGAPAHRAPAAVRVTPALSPPPRPAMAVATGGAAVLLAALVGGQLLFPAKGSIEAEVALEKPIHLEGAPGGAADSPKSETDAKQPYTVSKIPTESSANDPGVRTASDMQPNKVDEKSASSTPAEPDAVTPAVADVGPPRKRVVALLDGKLSLDIYRHPVLGSPEAPHVVVEFVSYDCPHCHHMAKIVRRALDRYGNKVAVVVLVIPSGIECNKEITSAANSVSGSCTTARMALSVARLAPEKFANFHDWLMDPKDKPPSQATVVQKAYNTVSRERIMNLSKDDFQKQVNQNIDLFNAIAAEKGGKKPGLPLLILGKKTISGTPANEETFISSWAEYLGLEGGPAAKTPAL